MPMVLRAWYWIRSLAHLCLWMRCHKNHAENIIAEFYVIILPVSILLSYSSFKTGINSLHKLNCKLPLNESLLWLAVTVLVGGTGRAVLSPFLCFIGGVRVALLILL